MALKQITAATEFPVTLDEIKVAARLLDTAFDDLLGDYLPAAVTEAESILGRSLMPQVWQLASERFCNRMELPRGPVKSITSVQYYDGNEVLQTLSSAVYALDDLSDPPRLLLKPGQSWPMTGRTELPVRITYATGFVDAAAVPYAIKTAIKALVVHWFENDALGEVPPGVHALLFPHRSFGF